jgi:hypothetical protein
MSSNALGGIIEDLQKSASSRHGATKRAKYAALTFIIWSAKTEFDMIESIAAMRTKPLFGWVINTLNDPLEMNCWEAVLYSGAWSDNNTRAVYSREYAFWALQTRSTPMVSYAPEQKTKVPSFVKHVIDNPIYHTTTNDYGLAPRSDDESSETKKLRKGALAIPDTIPAGMIAVFTSGSHVSLVTGNRRDNTNKMAKDVYGPSGHEVLELDGGTLSIERATIEDTLYRKGAYAKEIHLGWLPEHANQETITLVDTRTGQNIVQVIVPACNFYS